MKNKRKEKKRGILKSLEGNWIKISLKMVFFFCVCIFGEIKAYCNSSSALLSEVIHKFTHAIMLPRKLLGFFLVLYYWKTIYCIGYINVCWNKNSTQGNFDQTDNDSSNERQHMHQRWQEKNLSADQMFSSQPIHKGSS